MSKHTTLSGCATPHLGLDEPSRAAVIGVLDRALANEALLLIKTKKMHWDVSGPQFLTLHELWERQYSRVSALEDSLAERVRMLGGFPTATATGFLQLTSLIEHPGSVPNATAAVLILLGDHELIVRDVRKAIDLCEERHDRGTGELLVEVMRAHESMAWTLRSFLSGDAIASDGELATGPVPALA